MLDSTDLFITNLNGLIFVCVLYKTYRFRIKDRTRRNLLLAYSRAVNTVWNYCNEISAKSSQRLGSWVSKSELLQLTKGSSQVLGVSSQTIQHTVLTFNKCRGQYRKPKLRWRTKKSLGWIPITNQTVRLEEGVVVFCRERFRIWEHRKIEGKIKSGCFSQDARGRWYINLVCEVEKKETNNTKVVGIDLGLLSIAKTTIGQHLGAGRFYRDLEEKISTAQSKKKKKLVKTLYARASNRRKDALHKFSKSLVDQAGAVFVGNVNIDFLIIQRRGKAAYDSSWGLLRNYLRYKCDYAGVVYAEVPENYTTQMCSVCKELTGPKGEEGLSVRQWVCSGCGSEHDRDINAAHNIARLGCEMVGLPTRLN